MSTVVSSPVLQDALIKHVKELGSDTKYSRSFEKGKFPMDIVTFADALKTEREYQIRMLSGLLIGTLSASYVFHTLTLFSKRAKRPVRFVTSVELLGTSAAAHEGFLRRPTYHKSLLR